MLAAAVGISADLSALLPSMQLHPQAGQGKALKIRFLNCHSLVESEVGMGVRVDLPMSCKLY